MQLHLVGAICEVHLHCTETNAYLSYSGHGLTYAVLVLQEERGKGEETVLEEALNGLRDQEEHKHGILE